MQKLITIFTDGASSGNPGPGGWGSIIRYDGEITELGGFEARTTNNRMELTAVIRALEFVVEHNLSTSPVTLYTDSSYVANGITKWIKGWQARNWTNSLGEPVANVDLWKDAVPVLREVSVKFVNVAGHAGIPGNERCDEIATGYSKGVPVHLYHGAYDQYHHDLDNLKADAKKKSSKSKSGQKAFSYLSLVDGNLVVHTNWNDCKKRVEGTKGARFKKAVSKEDEETIRRSWGV